MAGFGALALLALAALLMSQSGALAAVTGGTQAKDLAVKPPADRLATINGIIEANVESDFYPDIAKLMADMENGFSIGLLTPTFQATNSLFNRHEGSGAGFWTGKTYNAGPADPDLRIYSSIEQSVQDFMQLMNDPLYATAREAARRGDITGYIAAVAAVGYSAQAGYQAALTSRAHSLGYLV